MIRHIVLIAGIAAGALAAGVAMVPGEHEQWTMLVRDGRNQQALKVLETRYRAGHREVDAVIHLYRLYMAVADVDQASRLLQEFVADHPDNVEALGMMASHFAAIEDKPGEVAVLERLFELAPTLSTARELLAFYRMEGAFDREEKLMRVLLAKGMITANDAERLGLMLASHGDLFGAREALMRFDELANPERSTGRLVLFDLLVATGDKSRALAKAAAWIGYFRKASIHHPTGSETPAARLLRMMVAVDEGAARRLICDAQAQELLLQPGARASDGLGCEADAPGAQPGPEPPSNAMTDLKMRHRIARRRLP
jgi:hypothetical protein